MGCLWGLWQFVEDPGLVPELRETGRIQMQKLLQVVG